MSRKYSKRHRATVGGDIAQGKRLIATFTPALSFSRVQAVSALVYLRTVAEDLQRAFRHAVECHDQLQHAVLREQVTQIEAKQSRAIARFDRALDEIELTGAIVLDCADCALAFPSLSHGEVVYRVWTVADDRLSPARRLESLRAAAARKRIAQ